MLEGIRSSVGTTLSESSMQQQDLDSIKDDLRTLKFGYVLLHKSNAELSEESDKHWYKLKQIGMTLEEQGVGIDSIISFVQSLGTHVVTETNITEHIMKGNKQIY